MQFTEMGNQAGKTLLLLPGTACTWQLNFKNVVDELAAKYHTRGTYHEKTPVFRIAIAAVVYLALFPLASVCGLIHPACYAYVGTLAPILFGFVYLYTAANLQSFGAAAILNGFTLIIGLIAGEGNLPFVVGMIVLALAAELVRRLQGYDSFSARSKHILLRLEHIGADGYNE